MTDRERLAVAAQDATRELAAVRDVLVGDPVLGPELQRAVVLMASVALWLSCEEAFPG